MNSALRHLRPLLISFAVLILTAGIAFAAKPSTPAAGLSVATHASGTTVQAATESAENAESDTKDAASGNHCSASPIGLTAAQVVATTHGAIVCWAAHQPTPAGYKNHGAWVSHWAKQNAGSSTSGDAGTNGAGHASSNGAGKGAGLSHKP